MWPGDELDNDTGYGFMAPESRRREADHGPPGYYYPTTDTLQIRVDGASFDRLNEDRDILRTSDIMAAYRETFEHEMGHVKLCKRSDLWRVLYIANAVSTLDFTILIGGIVAGANHVDDRNVPEIISGVILESERFQTTIARLWRPLQEGYALVWEAFMADQDTASYLENLLEELIEPAIQGTGLDRSDLQSYTTPGPVLSPREKRVNALQHYIFLRVFLRRTRQLIQSVPGDDESAVLRFIFKTVELTSNLPPWGLSSEVLESNRTLFLNITFQAARTEHLSAALSTAPEQIATRLYTHDLSNTQPPGETLEVDQYIEEIIHGSTTARTDRRNERRLRQQTTDAFANARAQLSPSHVVVVDRSSERIRIAVRPDVSRFNEQNAICTAAKRLFTRSVLEADNLLAAGEKWSFIRERWGPEFYDTAADLLDALIESGTTQTIAELIDEKLSDPAPASEVEK